MRGARRGFTSLTSALAVLVCMLLALHAVPARSAVGHRAEIRAASLASSAGTASLMFELNRTTSCRLFTLAGPGRVVIDLGDSRLAPGAHMPHGHGIVQTMRAGLRPHGGLRIVVQLESSAAPGGRVRLPVHAVWRRGRVQGTARLIVMIGEPSARSASEGTEAPKIDAPDAPRSELRPIPAPHAPGLADRDVVIAVDAGHGGKDPGAIGRDGTQEKNVTLAIARALAGRIDAQPGMRAVLTRDSDVFLLLGDRTARARAAHADLFVSVHADSVRDPAVSGASVYVLSEHGATDEAARVLAERENAADQLGGIPLAGKSNALASVLIDLAQTASISASMSAAQGVIGALDRVGEVRKPQVQQAAFVVLKSPAIPSMLIETAYISNRADERRLRTAREQRKLADAIFSGLLGYFEQHPPSGTRFARLLNEGSGSVLAGAPSGLGGSEAAIAP